MKKISKFSVTSNIVYIVPTFVSLLLAQYSIAILYTLLFTVSTLFHIYQSKIFSFLDSLVSYAIIITGILILYTKNFSVGDMILIGSIILSALIVRYYTENKTRDDLWHGTWHILVASLLTVLSLGE